MKLADVAGMRIKTLLVAFLLSTSACTIETTKGVPPADPDKSADRTQTTETDPTDPEGDAPAEANDKQHAGYLGNVWKGAGSDYLGNVWKGAGEDAGNGK